MDQGKKNSPSGKSIKGTVIFLGLYTALVAAAMIVLFSLMPRLRQRLVSYEAAQLEHRCEQVFEELFADPDWEKLYTLSGTKDTPYEGAEAYTAYMEAKVGSKKLTCEETHSGQPGVHRYKVFLGREEIAAFTMTGSEGTFEKLPQWTLSTVEIFFRRTIGVTVEKRPEYTVYINGVALDDSFTVRTIATKAEAYLPEGIHGYRMEQQHIDGLLVQPEVSVLDEKGETVALWQNPETGVYTLQSSDTEEMTETEKTLAQNAAQADAMFSLRCISAAELRKYFDAESQIYQTIVSNPMSVQGNRGCSVDESSIEIDQYYRYSDALFSAKVKLNVKVIRKDGTVKVYPLDKTYFFTRKDGDRYLVTDYTNELVQEKVELVRLTFVTNEGEQVSCMTDRGAETVAVPELSDAVGKQLLGWAVKTDHGDSVTMTVRLLPTGEVLGELEPMELYPVYQTKSEG